MSAPAPSAAKTLGALGLLTLALPLDLALTGLAAARGAATRRTPRGPVLRAGEPNAPLTVLVSGGKMTKALQLCRSFHAAGHRVVLVESAKYHLTGHRFSRSVDAFHTIADAGADDYAEVLLAIAQAEDVDVYVPVCAPATALPDARAKALLEQQCVVLHPDPDQVELLDDKHAFARAAAELGLSVPDTHLVTDPRQVLDFDFTDRPRPYILKSIAYDPVHRLDLTRLPFPPGEEAAMAEFVAGKPISPDNPWILQEYVEGRELCTHSTVLEGRLRVYLCCASSAFQVNYAMLDRPRVRAWVETFLGALGLTGQVSFDFIEDADGTPWAIECNPRTHSAITMLHDHPGVAAAYLDGPGPGGGAGDEVVVPLPGSRPTYWLHHELWRLLAGPDRLATVRTLLAGTDAILDRHDPLPFLLVAHLQIPALLLASLRRGGAWIRIDFNIGKLVEPAGD